MRDELNEEKEFEDELLFSIAMILAEIIKIYNDAFLDLLALWNGLLRAKRFAFLSPSPQNSVSAQSTSVLSPQFVHKTGFYIVCDVFEQCSRAQLETDQWLGAFVRAVFSILHSDDDAFMCWE